MKLPSLAVVSKRRFNKLEEDLTRAQTELIVTTNVLRSTVRIGFKPLNLINVTSELRRRVEGSLTLDYDGNNITLRGNRPLEESEFNLVVSILGFSLNRT